MFDANDEAIYRLAGSGDAAAIAGVHVRGWHDTYTGIVPQAVIDRGADLRQRTTEWTARLTGRPADIVFVVQARGAVRGFVWVGQVRADALRDRVPGYQAYMYGLYVDSAAHRRGFGRNLVYRARDALLARGLRSLGFHVVAANPARGFYERLGAQFVGAETLHEGTQTWVQCAYGWPNIRRIGTLRP